MTSAIINGHTFDVQTSGRSRNFAVEPGDVLRFEVRPGDTIPGGGPNERSEIGNWSEAYPTTCNVEFDLMVEPGPRNTAAWLCLSQFRQSSKAPDGSPPFALELAGEEFRIVARKAPSDYMRLFADPGFQRGRWYWFKARFDFVRGEVDVFRDNVQIVNYRGPIGYSDPKGGYWKAGIYRAPAPETMVARFRGLTIST